MQRHTMHDRQDLLADEDLASQSDARVLITAATRLAVETIAQRIHDGSVRAALPFVRLNGADLPTDPLMLRTACSCLCDVAGGGSVLVNDIETMPASVQEQFLRMLDELELPRDHGTVRLLAGTTVLLFDRVAAGTFSERLFYRLNVLHLHGARDRSVRTRTEGR